MKHSIIILLLFCSQIFSQEIEFVNAPNGLIIRDSPNLNSNRVGKLDYGNKVTIIKRTGIKLEIKDEGKIVSGEWTKVKDLTNNFTGFVFSGFLTKKAFDRESESNRYYLTKIDPKVIKQYKEDIPNYIEPKSPYIFLRDHNHRNLFKISISEFEIYENTAIHVRDLLGLENIKKLITIESLYSACCSFTEEYFFLIDLNDNLIELPKVDNTHCDAYEPFLGYIFPKEKYGKEKKIIYGKIIPNEKGENEKVEILKTYSWNGVRTIAEK